MVVPEPEVDWALETEARPEARARKTILLIEVDMTNYVICCVLNERFLQK